MLKILFFVIIFGVIVSSPLFVEMVVNLGTAIAEINTYFFPYLPWELKLLFSIVVLGAIYKLYNHFIH